MIGDIVKQIKLAIQDAQDMGAVCNREYWEGVENGLIQAIDIINKQKGDSDMGYKNSEGYSDPTAGVAMGSAKKQEQEIDKLNHKVMQSFRLLLDLAGFEIVGRVTLRHKKSGRIFK
ncbi:MAG: hypothetical protein Q4P27_02675 [Eubacteriales bacterium]|nr:hypothetical protein [Eubacteriales bacterium]